MHDLHRLLHLRRHLRNNSTSAEAILWSRLKCRKLEGRKFRRQHSIFEIIVDFYCPEERLIIELDREGHFTEDGVKKDQLRDTRLASLDFRVLRYENQLVFADIDSVLNDIKQHFTTHG